MNLQRTHSWPLLLCLILLITKTSAQAIPFVLDYGVEAGIANEWMEEGRFLSEDPAGTVAFHVQAEDLQFLMRGTDVFADERDSLVGQALDLELRYQVGWGVGGSMVFMISQSVTDGGDEPAYRDGFVCEYVLQHCLGGRATLIPQFLASYDADSDGVRLSCGIRDTWSIFPDCMDLDAGCWLSWSDRRYTEARYEYGAESPDQDFSNGTSLWEASISFPWMFGGAVELVPGMDIAVFLDGDMRAAARAAEGRDWNLAGRLSMRFYF